jgi:hypothetical protein
MGLLLRRSDPWEDMRGLRFVFRDTAPAAEMRADFNRFRVEQESKLRASPGRRRNPVEAWPSELLFFFRAILLLRGLGASLGARLPYLATISPTARLAILQQYPRELHAKVS